jgi:hypothetical protein
VFAAGVLHQEEIAMTNLMKKIAIAASLAVVVAPAAASAATAHRSLSISVTVVATPVTCQDYQVGDKVVARCGDGQRPIVPPAGGILFGAESYIPGIDSVATDSQAPAPTASAASR